MSGNFDFIHFFYEMFTNTNSTNCTIPYFQYPPGIAEFFLKWLCLQLAYFMRILLESISVGD